MVWKLKAKCRGSDPSIFFPDGGGDYYVQNYMDEEAANFCAGCPVEDDCLSWALDNLPEGVAGGKTADQRRSILRRRQRVA